MGANYWRGVASFRATFYPLTHILVGKRSGERTIKMREKMYCGDVDDMIFVDDWFASDR